MSQMKEGCVKAARGPIAAAENASATEPVQREVTMQRAQVGHEAPDFEANAFVAGAGFKPIRLSEYRGKWIVLCFYPGDFTFV